MGMGDSNVISDLAFTATVLFLRGVLDFLDISDELKRELKEALDRAEADASSGYLVLHISNDDYSKILSAIMNVEIVSRIHDASSRMHNYLRMARQAR